MVDRRIEIKEALENAIGALGNLETVFFTKGQDSDITAFRKVLQLKLNRINEELEVKRLMKESLESN